MSRYSINIEAQNDLNQITILLNDPQKNKLDRKNVSESDGMYSEEELEINDDDMISDKDKYSMYYSCSRKHLNFNELPDVRESTNSFRQEFDMEIEGPAFAST